MTIAAHTKLGRYEIISPIGAGGMGEVYLAEDVRLNRKVALKILPENIATDKECLLRFEREAQAASALNHPNIITIHEIGETGDQLFIATEYIEGSTLRQKIEENDLAVYESVRISEQIAAALSVAHGAHIIHRDIKPENIMIRRDGYVKILDFGLAKLVEKKSEIPDAEAETRAQVNTKAGMIMGTVAYMSPEQARGKDIDERTDVWSLGVCLYEMLTGKQPFTGETTNDTIAAILTKESVQLDGNLPAELHRIVKKTLQKDADKRYQTAKDLLIDLEEVKEELKFQSKLERTAAPNREEPKTKILAATTADVAHITSSAEYVVNEIKSHKSGFAIGLIVLLLASVGFGYWLFSNRSSNATQIESIAVLPFVNESGNADNEYLSDGMTESLINSLSQLPNMKVIARSSAFRYKGKEIDLQKIAKDLNVQAMMTGRVVQRGDTLDISVDLTDTQNNTQLWGQRYTRKLSDVFAVQDEIAKQVADSLRVKLTGEQQERLTKRYTGNEESYQLYLRGRFYLNKHTTESAKKAVNYFKQAIEKDSNYALAYAGLSDAYDQLAGTAEAPPDKLYPQAHDAVTKALEIDNQLAEAHTSLAIIKQNFDWDWKGAESEYQQALALNPNDAIAHDSYGMFLANMRRFDEAFIHLKRAQELDPLSLYISKHIGTYYLFTSQYDRAIEQLRLTLELDPNFVMTYYDLGWAYAHKGMYPEAVAQFQKMLELEKDNSSAVSGLGYSYALWGKQDEAQKIIKQLEEMSMRQYVSSDIASVYAGLGDKDRAFVWLEKMYLQREATITSLKIHPPFETLRSDPRFQDLLRRVGLPQ
jgi:serine/threonine-protein kinase